MLDLEQYAKTVFNMASLADKKTAMMNLMNKSHAKATTKATAVRQLDTIKIPAKVDMFAFNYMLCGEGLGVIK